MYMYIYVDIYVCRVYANTVQYVALSPVLLAKESICVCVYIYYTCIYMCIHINTCIYIYIYTTQSAPILLAKESVSTGTW